MRSRDAITSTAAVASSAATADFATNAVPNAATAATSSFTARELGVAGEIPTSPGD